jgi:hypothetical protein
MNIITLHKMDDKIDDRLSSQVLLVLVLKEGKCYPDHYHSTVTEILNIFPAISSHNKKCCPWDDQMLFLRIE